MKIIFLFMVSFASSYVLVPLVRKACYRYKFLDVPSRRKIHTRPTPRLGGVAVISAFLATLIIFFIIDGGFRAVFHSKFSGFLIAVLLLFGLGLWDDIRGIKPVVKLLGQAVVALVLFQSGLRIKVLTTPLFGGEIQLGYFISLVLTLLWFVGLINAVNLIDGLDGLASGLVFIASACLLIVGLYLNTPVTVALLSILCGSTLGFLRYNFPPAKIFLGDTGSMFLGLAMAAAGIVGLQYKVATAVTLLIPLCALTIPIFDTFLAMGRRSQKKSSIFIADKKHLHHRLLQLGLNQKQVVVVFYLATLYFGIISFLFVLIPDEYAVLLLFILGIGLFFGLRTVGLIERKLRRIHLLQRRLHREKARNL